MRDGANDCGDSCTIWEDRNKKTVIIIAR
jgi:hypothetical protein